MCLIAFNFAAALSSSVRVFGALGLDFRMVSINWYVESAEEMTLSRVGSIGMRLIDQYLRTWSWHTVMKGDASAMLDCSDVSICDAMVIGGGFLLHELVDLSLAPIFSCTHEVTRDLYSAIG